MIQYPLSGELVVEVPRIGAIILEKPYDYLNRAFEGCLVKGRRVGPQNPGVEWLIGSATKCSEADPGVADAVQAIRERAARVASAASELDRIARSRLHARAVRVPAAVLSAIGRPIEAEHTEISRETAAVLAEVLRKGAAGVLRAVDRGNVVTAGGRYLLYGWCFLPPDGLIDPGSPPAIVIQYGEEPVEGRSAAQVVTWNIDADAEAIELLRADGSEQAVAGTFQELERGRRSGQWRFLRGELLPGESYSARARWVDGVVMSAPIKVPAARPTTRPPAPPPSLPSPAVSLDYAFDGAQSTEGMQRLRWRIDGPADAIALVRVDRGGIEVEGTAREIAGELEGEWAFPDGTLPGGSQYLARAMRSAAACDSNVVTVPRRPTALSRCRRRCCVCCRRLCSLRWLKWLLAALLALLALSLLAWLLFSGSCSGLSLPTGLFGSRDRSASAPGAAPAGSDSDSPPRTPRPEVRSPPTPPRPPSTQPKSPKPEASPASPPSRPPPPAVPSASPSAAPAAAPAPRPSIPVSAPPATPPPAPAVTPPPSEPVAPRAPGSRPGDVTARPGTPAIVPENPQLEPTPRELVMPGGRRPIKIVDPGIRRREPRPSRVAPDRSESPGTSGSAGVPGELSPVGSGAEGVRP